MNKSETVGRYQLLHLVHQGYLGSLWAARGVSGDAQDLPALVRRIELPPDLGEEQQALITEAAWDSLEVRHAHLLSVAEVMFADGVFALAYDYAEAEVLQALLLMGTVKKTPLSPEVITRILLDTVEGLSAVGVAAAGLGVNPYHGGVSPESIVIGSDGCARLVDHMVGGAITAHTRLRTNPGRVGYCSPEQLRGEATSEQSDVFALGVILAELLAGRRLFLGAGNVIEKKILEGNLPQINGWLKPGAGIQAKLLDVLDRAIQADASKRISSPRALADEVCAVVSQPASPSQVGVAVQALASKQLEVRSRKLGLHSGPRLSQKVSPERAPRSSSRGSLPAPAAAAAPKPTASPLATTLLAGTPAAAAVLPERNLPAPVAVNPQVKSSTAAEDNTVGVDELLVGIPAAAKREEMQSGTHRKVMSTLIGVAPPPPPVIGRPPAVTVPTAVIVNDVPPLRARNAAGIADLLGTSVPSTRDAVAPVSIVLSERPKEEPIVVAVQAPGSSPTDHGELSSDPRLLAVSQQLSRYRRLTVLLGSTTVLLLTLLIWLVVGGLRGSAKEAAAEPTPNKAIAREPQRDRTERSATAAQLAPATSAATATILPAVPAATDHAAGTAAVVTKPVRPTQKKPGKKFIPDDI